ncbi:hypothetical protein HanXRQr2_Chr08g0328711 [Helianthus annuus]|uniref:Uncharacterized protein n=1 Tax=Helianthus annuus TaxID=4232 RepID=A0A9K3NC88_HELAN|nr:hypothetical protein HanXRQr2_Chr08g0328711 [Helianthus annuus]KAJ0900791.1 hypothetical protein HanPSC8_Chr08g0317771 [Helianthus annuus]
MMDPEDLQSDLLALRRLYMLLVQDEHYIEDAASENLDDNARRLLINLLDAAANKAFDAHAKILDAQVRATNSLWSTPQGQSRDGLNLRSFSMRKAPTDAAYVDLLTGDWNFSESTDQADLAGDPGTRMKRCRVCRKTKVKQLTKEISFTDSKALTPINGQFSINLTDQEDQISREASAKILQLESCISSLQVAAKHTNFLKNEPENEPKQTGIVSVSRSDPNSSTSQMIWKPIDMGQQCDDQTTRLINELALQGPLVNTTLPSGQTVSQQVEEPVVNKIETFNPITNQYNNIPEEPYYLFPSGGISSKMANKNRFLHRSLSSQINRQPLDQLQMGRKEAMRTSEMTEWRDPVEFVGRKQPGETYDDQMDRYRGKHEVVDTKRLVSESPVSSSNYATWNQSPSQSYNSFSVSEKSESEMNSVSSQDESPYKSSSFESLGSMSRRTVPKRGYKEGGPKEPNRISESKMKMDSSRDLFPYMSSGSDKSSRSRRTVPEKGNKKGDQEEPKRKSESKMNTVSSRVQSPYMSSRSNESSGWSGSGSGSGSRRTVPKKGHQKESKRISESKMSTVSSMDQSSYTGSSKSSTEPEESQVGRLGKLKDKLAVIFHHHHHHHHHHHGSSEEEDYKKVLWRNAKKVIGQGGKAVKKIEKNALPAIKKYEAHGEVMVKKMEKKALPAIKKYAAHGEHAVKKIEKKALPAIKKYASHGEHAVKKIEKKALPAIKKYASHGEHAVKKIYKKAHGKHAVKKNDHNALAIKDEAHSEHTIKKNENKALVLMKDEAHGEHAVKKNENKALVLMKDEAHGEHAVKKNESKALVLVTDYGEHTVKKNENKALVLMKNDAHGEHTVKKNENKALVLMKNEAHGEHAVKKTENKALVIKKDAAHGEHAVKKSDNMALVLHKAAGDKDSKALVLHKPGGNKESKALVVRKPGGKKQTSQMQALMGGLLKNSRRSTKKSKSKSVENTGGKKQASQMQALMGGLLKNSRRSTKTSKSKSGEKRTPSGSNGQKNIGGVKTGQKMQWFQMLRQQRKVERLEKLRKKVDYDKVAATLKRP